MGHIADPLLLLLQLELERVAAFDLQRQPAPFSGHDPDGEFVAADAPFAALGQTGVAA